MTVSQIDKLNKELEKVENEIDNNADGEPTFLLDLFEQRAKLEKKINELILRDF